MSELTISRADLIEIATEALEKAEDITNEQRVEMCETAHMTKEILVGGWLTKDCGCLVGATYRDVLKYDGGSRVQETLGEGMRRLGNDFDRKLRRKLGDYCGLRDSVRVIEDDSA